ncbi:MAG: formylglycine-generating enzyme family protein [Verrucomicrobiales bacterium]
MKWIIPVIAASALAGSLRAQGFFEGQQAGEARSDNALKMAFHWCPPGEFVMGSPVDEPGRDDDEGQHTVRLTQGFWLGETEVTQGQWAAVMGQTLRYQARKMLDDPKLYLMGGKEVTLRQASKALKGNEISSVCAAEAPNVPIYYVSWEDAVEFCRKLTAKERAAKRLPPDAIYGLPTESQWEHACRAGTTTTTYSGDMIVLGENNAPVLNEIAFYGGNSSVGYKGRGWTTQNWPNQAFPGKIAGPRRVGQKQPNPWQLRDMLGNLYEWVEDYSGYYPQRDVVDPRGPPNGGKRIFRGGSWNHLATMSRAARRFEEIPTIRLNYIGLRVALRLQAAEQPP